MCPKLREILQTDSGYGRISIFLYTVVVVVAIGISRLMKAFDAVRKFHILEKELKMSEATDWVKCTECGHVMLGPITECEKCGYNGKNIK